MTKNFNILYKKGKYYNTVGKNPKKPLSFKYGKRLYNKQYPKPLPETTLSIRLINGEYYNDNGKNPHKPLSKSYGKRLFDAQKRYGKTISFKDAHGHGKLKTKKSIVEKIKGDKSNKDKVKQDIRLLNKTDYSEFLKKIGNREINTQNMRTRFRAIFKVYHDDAIEYDVISHGSASDGVKPLESYLKDIPNDVFGENVFGSFRYVIYDKITKQVYHDLNYDVELT